MGGATGLITTALDKRIACLVDVFGSGYIADCSCWTGFLRRLPASEQIRWTENFDPRQYVDDITVPVLAVTATNDGCYYLPIFEKTVHRIKCSDLCYVPNLNHRLSKDVRASLFSWLEGHLCTDHERTKSTALGRCRDVASISLGEMFDTGLVRVAADAPGAVAADLIYSRVYGQGYTSRKWTVVPCVRSQHANRWIVNLPISKDVLDYTIRCRYADGTIRCSDMRILYLIRQQGKLIVVAEPYRHITRSLVQYSRR